MSDENDHKRRLDALASELLHVDGVASRRRVEGFVGALGDVKELRLCVTGGAGSGKTSFAVAVAKSLGVPVFDFDEYIEGGYHPDGKEYRARLAVARQKLWTALPEKGGWIVEHVEACNEDMMKLLSPTHCALIEPSIEYAMRVAEARSAAANDGPVSAEARKKRALESREYARMQFDKVKGKTMFSKNGTTLKRVS